MGAKNEEAGKPEIRLVVVVHPSSNPDEDKLEELNKTGTISDDENSMIDQTEEAEKSGKNI